VTALSEQEFRLKSDTALEEARRSLMTLADEDDFEIELQNGVLNLVFEEPKETKFVVSPNTPMRQIWVSWSDELQTFALGDEPLPRLLERLTRTFLAQ